MGYTHNWTFIEPKGPKGTKAKIEEKYQLAIRQCQRIVKAYNNYVKSFDEKSPNRLSGYSAHCKIGEYGGLNVNGVGENAHEPFTMREHFGEIEFDFCKTARKPYDDVVTACLITLKYYLGDCIEIGSDGDADEWENGLILAKAVTKIKKLDVPQELKEEKAV